MGNLRSVAKALERVGATVTVSPTVPDGDAELLVVPGQGHFGACVRTLGPSLDAVRAWITADRPFLGICLGLQLLFESSAESPEPGAAIFAGRVERFGDGMKVPHIGWNSIATQPAGERYFGEIADGTRFYFVHSYFPVPADPSIIAARTTHGDGFCSAVARGPLLATQFHPEKSGGAGLALLGAVVREARAA